MSSGRRRLGRACRHRPRPGTFLGEEPETVLSDVRAALGAHRTHFSRAYRKLGTSRRGQLHIVFK